MSTGSHPAPCPCDSSGRATRCHAGSRTRRRSAGRPGRTRERPDRSAVLRTRKAATAGGAIKRKQDFQFAKPENKKNGAPPTDDIENNLRSNSIAVDIKKPSPRKSARTPTNQPETIEVQKTVTPVPVPIVVIPMQVLNESNEKHSSDIIVKKMGKIAQIILNSRDNKLKDCFNVTVNQIFLFF